MKIGTEGGSKPEWVVMTSLPQEVGLLLCHKKQIWIMEGNKGGESIPGQAAGKVLIGMKREIWLVQKVT